MNPSHSPPAWLGALSEGAIKEAPAPALTGIDERQAAADPLSEVRKNPPQAPLVQAQAVLEPLVDGVKAHAVVDAEHGLVLLEDVLQLRAIPPRLCQLCQHQDNGELCLASKPGTTGGTHDRRHERRS